MTQALATLRKSGALIVLVVTYVVFSVAAPSFFGVQNLLDIVHVISPMMIVATGMALVVMSGKLDISVGSIAYVASALFALIMRNGSLSFPAAVVPGGFLHGSKQIALGGSGRNVLELML